MSMPPSSGQRLVSVNRTRCTGVERQHGGKSRWQPGGGVPKAAERMGQDSGDRLRLQTEDGEKLGRLWWPQRQEE